MLTQEQIENAGQLAVRNREQLAESDEAGCYYCRNVFPASEVSNYVIEEDGTETAVCPKCGLDSVLADSAGIELSAENLEQLNEYWF
ncbi:cytoplasmic protein [Patescibacteria group bacterium]